LKRASTTARESIGRRDDELKLHIERLRVAGRRNVGALSPDRF
jgi:hypothetical protein